MPNEHNILMLLSADLTGRALKGIITLQGVRWSDVSALLKVCGFTTRTGMVAAQRARGCSACPRQGEAELLRLGVRSMCRSKQKQRRGLMVR